MAPGLGPAIKHATVFPDDGHVVDPFGLVGQLAKVFVAQGGRIERTAATGFETFDNAVFAVKTAVGARPADLVVVSAGVESREVARWLALHLPLVAERGYHLMLDKRHVAFDIAVTSAERSFVMTPMTTGLRLAGTVEFGRMDDPPSWERAEVLARHLRALFPDIEPRELSRWMGRRPTLPDFLPAIGRVPGLANVMVATGHQHLGLTLAMITARLIADLAAGRPPRVDLAPFDPGRFS
jgi:D-amino-acid dehydrogenase